MVSHGTPFPTPMIGFSIFSTRLALGRSAKFTSVKNTTAASTPRVSGGRLMRAMVGRMRRLEAGGEAGGRPSRIGPGRSRRAVEVSLVN